MRRRDFLAGLGFGLGAGCAGLRSSKVASQLGALEQLIPRLMAEYVVPGAAIAVAQNGGLAWARDFGVRRAGSKGAVNRETLFEAASVSKTVFAYAALKLCEKGVIGLDTPLARHAKRPFAEGDPRIEKITPRHLLSHSSGFAEWRSGDGPLIRREPGAEFEYSGEGYFYLQSVITELLGSTDPRDCAKFEADFEVCATDFDELMKRRLLRPFGMRSSGYAADESWPTRTASGHGVNGQPHELRKPTGPGVARYGAVGGLNTTAREYAKFLIEVVAPKSPDEFRLGADMRREMARPQIKLPKGGEIDGCGAWALGWGVQETDARKLLVHSGGQSGFRSLALASIERQAGFIIFTNSDNGGRVIFHPEVLKLAGELVMQPDANG